MRMLCLHSGSFSGITASLLESWRAEAPDVAITRCDLDEESCGSRLAKVRAASVALRARGLAALAARRGDLLTEARRSRWYMDRMVRSVARLQGASPHDFSLSLQSTVPVIAPLGPHFVYTDHTILANHCYPGGEASVRP